MERVFCCDWLERSGGRPTGKLLNGGTAGFCQTPVSCRFFGADGVSEQWPFSLQPLSVSVWRRVDGRM